LIAMPIRAVCPTCGLSCQAPDKLLGRNIACRRCGHPFLIQEAADPPAPVAVAEEPPRPRPRAPEPPETFAPPAGTFGNADYFRANAMVEGIGWIVYLGMMILAVIVMGGIGLIFRLAK